jgi:aspartyl-tRNA(Asn)/glutamyl-tRNA(Gln) amidotransferase subunit A
MSLDQIGPLAPTAEDCAVIFDVIKGKDIYDAVSEEFLQKKEKKELTIGILDAPADKKIWDLIKKNINKTVEKQKWNCKPIRLKHTDLGIQTYYPIVYVEFFSGTRKFDGRKYGKKIEDAAGDEVLRRILGGQEITKAEFAGKYYRRALKAKKIIEEEFEEAFKTYDVIILPTVPTLPHKLATTISVEDMYNYDVLTVLANLAGTPAISIPAGFIQEGKDEIPVGMQIIAPRGHDNFLLDVAKKFEKVE